MEQIKERVKSIETDLFEEKLIPGEGSKWKPFPGMRPPLNFELRAVEYHEAGHVVAAEFYGMKPPRAECDRNRGAGWAQLAPLRDGQKNSPMEGPIEGPIEGETAYMLANGSGKARANQNGGARTQARWRLIFLSAGELSLSQHMAEVGKKVHAGQELRMADIPADAGAGLGCFEQPHEHANGHEFSKALAGVMGRYYGTAFPEFVRRALAAGETLETSLREAQAAFEKVALSSTASGQARRAAARFALVGAAGEFATEWGITGWNAGESMKAAQACFAAWLVAYGGEGNQEQRAMLDKVRRFLESHGEARFSDFSRSVSNDDHAPRVINKAGWRKHDKVKDETEYYIYPQVFKDEVCSGMDYKAVARLLIDNGYMRADGKHLHPKVALPGEGTRRVFHLLSTIWSDKNA